MPEGAPATVSYWHPRSPYARAIVGATALLALASVALCYWIKPVLLVVTGCIPCGAGASAGAYILLRSVRLSAVAGLSTAGAVAISSGAFVASGWLSIDSRAIAAIFVEGLVVAALVLWQLRITGAELSAGAATNAVARIARDRTLRPGIASLVLVIVPGSLTKAATLAAVVSAVVAMWFCFVVFPRLTAGSPVPEKTIVRFNRVQELFQRAVSPVEFLLEPRWALSATGIAAILFALVALDRVHMPDGRVVFAVLVLWNAPAIVFTATVAAMLAIGVAWSRSWRKALSITVAAIWAGIFAGWFVLRTGLNASFFDQLPFPAFKMAATGSAAVASFLFLVGSAYAGKVRDASEAQQAMTIALAESAAAVVSIAVAALLASALALSVPGIILAITSALAALVLLPCFYIALNALFPRYRSVEEVFGRE